MKIFQKIKTDDERTLKKVDENVIDKRLVFDKDIGSGEQIKAIHVEAKKSTHKTSYINAEYVSVKQHAGFIEGGDVEIGHLKGGKIVADTLRIDFLESGEVEANHIYINRLGSKSVLVAYDTVEIGKVEGSKNKIIIKPLIDVDYFDKLSKLYDKIMLFKKEFKEINSTLGIKQVDIESQISRIQRSRAEIAQVRKSGEMPNADTLVSIKEFDIFKREYTKLLDVLHHLEENIKNDECEFLELCNDFFFGGKVVSNSLWKENNDIIFYLPKYELEYTTSKNENAHEIYLRYNTCRTSKTDNEFEIEIKKRENDSSH
ncbi:MAG: hypothetical protein LBS73_00300 [Campylobacteraceae bacterium]|nr:hypothetical protein [Campylobacteraceae bacterium]